MKISNITKSKLLYYIIPIVLVAIVVIKLKKNKDTAQKNIYKYDKEQAINIEVDTLKKEYLNDEISFPGTFEAYKESKISAELQGKINSIFVDNGSNVHKGQTLLKIDDILLNEQLKIINTQIANMKAENDIQLQANQIQIDGVEADVNRYKILSNADAIQGVQLEKAEMQLKTLLNQQRTLKQQTFIKNAVAQKNQILQQINKTSIIAPFDGIVTSKLSEIGSYAAPGVPLLQISDISNLKFTINVAEDDLNYCKLNQKYKITIDAISGISLFGKIVLIGSKANIGNSFPVQFSVQNTSDKKIKSGMFGKVISIANDTKKETQDKGIIIPISSIIGNANQPQVYVVKNEKAILQNITTSKKIKNKVVVSSGLYEDDILVVNGFINLFDSANVSIAK